ncbi:MAG: membrane protein insertion efficiency factor YidD [Methylococcales bacterium]
MKALALFSIKFYQSYISPRKGFCCAYKHHTGHGSCSALGYRAISMYGVFSGIYILHKRTKLCGVAYRQNTKKPKFHLHSQRGFCDAGCDLPIDLNCDLPSFSISDSHGSGFFSKIFDFANCCDCGGCDWPSNNEKKKEEDKYIYIPPRRQHENLI